MCVFFFFFTQKTAYEMRISDGSSDVCSSDLHAGASLEASWKVDIELGLSALRNDIAALMRPLGIDAQVRLDFHNGSNDNWYVTEFGNSLAWEPSEIGRAHV